MALLIKLHKFAAQFGSGTFPNSIRVILISRLI